MQYKHTFFGEDEAACLAFVDKHWDRVINFGHSSEMPGESFEIPGWYARYAKDPVTPESVRLAPKKKTS